MERFLQRHLVPDIAESQSGKFLQYAFVVKPPHIPEALLKQTHGSAVREQSHEVYQPLQVLGWKANFFPFNTLRIKPSGAPGGMGGIWAMNEVEYRVPLRFITGIKILTQVSDFGFTPIVLLDANNQKIQEVIPVNHE